MGRPVSDSAAAIEQAEEETGLPGDDPVRFGAGKLLDSVLAAVGSKAVAVPADQ